MPPTTSDLTPTSARASGLGSAPTLVDGELEGVPERELEGGLSRGETVGRYVVLERVGQGGMGVVYAAYDRDLDRRVAIKLLHAQHGPDRTKGQARLLREAQAMAKLAHPHVVAVHEVGTYQGRPYVAMEFIDGPTLGQWRREATRPWREVVAVLLQAGRGLAAAHQQGLVHRDFKPDNVLLGRDGRARVLDFGLARSVIEGGSSDDVPLPSELLRPREGLPRDSTSIRLTQTGALAGTPAYMAPEQFRGLAPDARTDQFAFCVTLWEALYGERPFAGDTRAQLAMAVCKGELREAPPRDVPAFLRRALRRGLALRQDDRFPSMDALLVAIDRDPGRTRRRALMIGAGAVTIAVLSAGAARWAGGGEDDPCTGGVARLGGAWDDERQQAVRRAFERVEAKFAATSLETVQRELDDYAAGWLEGYRDACQATHVRHEQSSARLDRRMACLDRRRAALHATTELLATGDRDVVARSIGVVTALPALEECSRSQALMAGFDPPADPAVAQEVETLRDRLARASAMGVAGQAAAGQVEAREVETRAAALGYEPLQAEASMVLGQVAANAGDDEVALARMHAAVDHAVASGHDEVLVHATTDLLSYVGVNLSRYEEAERWGRLAAAAVRRRGGDVHDTIELDRSMCMMLADKGDPAAALPYCEEQLELSLDRFGPNDARTAVAHRAVGNAHYAAGELPQAEQAYERATELFLASHGLDHPEYPTLLNALAAVCYSQGRGEPCVALFEQTVQAAVRSFGPEHPAVADFTNNLAVVLQDQGRLDEAEVHAQRSLQLRMAQFGDGHPGVGAAHRVLADIAHGRGDFMTALHHADEAVRVLRATRGEAHPDVRAALTGRSRIRLAEGRIDGGLHDLEDALALAEQHDRPASERAPLRWALARALAEHRPGERSRVDELAAMAQSEAAALPLAQEIASWRAGLDGEAPPVPSP